MILNQFKWCKDSEDKLDTTSSNTLWCQMTYHGFFSLSQQKAKKLNVFKNDDETWDYTGALNNNSGL